MSKWWRIAGLLDSVHFMNYVPPDYDDELTPETREVRNHFRELLNLTLAKFRGETRRSIIAAMLHVLDAAADAGELCDPACEELKIEFQLRYHDVFREDGSLHGASEPTG